MTTFGDRAVEATLANQRIPGTRLEDSCEVQAISTAVTLRAARSGAGQVDERSSIGCDAGSPLRLATCPPPQDFPA